MLQELNNVLQEPRTKGYRRWFEDEEMELIVWYSDSDQITGFQLCYDIRAWERVFTWRQDKGIQHSVMDSGEQSPLYNRSPMLIPFPKAPIEQVLAGFPARSQSLDRGIAECVAGTIAAYRPPTGTT